MNRAKRDAQIVKLLKAGKLTQREIGEEYGLSRQRVDQIREREGLGTLGVSENGRAAWRAHAKSLAHSTEVSDRCQRAADLYLDGFGSFSAVADHVGQGMTRSAVAGAVQRERKRDAQAE